MLHVPVSRSSNQSLPDASGAAGSPGGPPPRAWPALPIVLGGAVGAGVVALRYAGILVGPAAVAAVVASLGLLPWPRRLADRFVVGFAVVFGWLPLLGWVPGIGTALDVPGVVLGAVAGLAAGGQVARLRGGSGRATSPSLSEWVAIGVGAATALWWAVPQIGLGLSGRLQYLTNGYDNVTHFAMFRANLASGSFEAVRRHLPGGAVRLGADYPQGAHQAWAQLVRLWAPHPPPTTAWLLDSYVTVLVLTNGLCVVLGCMAVVRICRREVLPAAVAMAAVAALFTFGLFGPFNGYPNFDLAVMAAAAAVTMAVRPMSNPGAHFAVVAGLGLVAAYNWYPLLLMVVPALVVSAVALRRASSGRARVPVGAALAGSALAFAAPLALFLHRGVSTLNTAGGVIPVPWGLLVVCGAGLGALVVYRHVLDGDRAVTLVVGAPAYLGLGALVLVLGYEVLSKGAVSYYGQKLAAGVFAVDLVVLACLVAERLAGGDRGRRMSRPVMTTIALLAAVAALEVDGYVGPAPQTLAASDLAAGVASHDVLTGQAKTSPGAAAMLAAARYAQEHQAQSGKAAGKWWYVNPGFGVYGFVYGEQGVWFSVLRGDPSQAEYVKITLHLAPHLLHAGSVDAVARVIDRNFVPTSDGLHLFVPSWLQEALVHRNVQWARPGLLLSIPSATR
jgi:hypothetical protein